MIRQSLIAPLLVIGIMISAAAADTVTFKGMSATGGGKPIMLTGNLTKPQGEGPFPAVVMLHGCLGMGWYEKYFGIWARRIASWGYVSLQVDSFGPRGESDICGADRISTIPTPMRAQDAHDAKSYLAGLPFVDRNQIALMGWSHGGWSVLSAIDETISIQNRGDPFRVAIAFYPYCAVPLRGFNAPLMILIGELDDWTQPELCQLRMPSGKTAHEIILKVYPEAYHCFDFEGLDTYVSGHRLLYNPKATSNAIQQVRKFLAKHL